MAGSLYSLAVADDAKRLPSERRNVIYVTWDGFRWQEFFGGAQQLFLSKDAGVDHVESLKARFWRDSEEERRATLLPFVWTTIAKRGQVFGDQTRNARAKLTNTHKFTYPGYSEMFCGFADDEQSRRDIGDAGGRRFSQSQSAFIGRFAACD